MRLPIGDLQLSTQLFGFMEVIPLLWSVEDLIKLADYQEERGSGVNSLQFGWEVLEDEPEYLLMLASVTDTPRSKDQIGSSWQPLSMTFVVRRDGSCDMPSAEDIYKYTFCGS